MMIFSQNLVMDITILTALAVSLLSLLVAVLALMKLRQHSALSRKLYHQLESSFNTANSSYAGMGKKLLSMERRWHDAKQPEPAVVQEQHTSYQASDSSPDMREALSLLRSGLEVDEVARRCGISRAEVSLMKLMQSKAGGHKVA